MNDEPTRELSKIILSSIKWSDRRMMLGKNQAPCPNCATQQVQLTNHFVTPAQWKCRECKTKFEYEP
jgi:ribosomal protein L37AE/L43A